MSGFSFDDLQDLDEGANDKPAPGGFDTLNDLDAQGGQPSYGYDSQGADDGFKPWSKPGDAGSPTTTRAGDRSRYVNPDRGSLSSLLADTGSDAAQGLAGGVFSGLGVNPQQDMGAAIRARQQLAADRSPMATGTGKFIGEAGIQTAAAPAALARAPAAAGALSGLLSGIGNTEGTLAERGRAGVGGAAVGAVVAPMVSAGTGKLQSLLENKGAQWGEEQASHGLMNRGATAGDLAEYDKLGGRQHWYDESNRLGITGKPPAAKAAAQRVIDETMQRRAALEATPNIQIDPSQVAARVRGSNPYPGVSSLDNAAGKAADDVQNSALEFDRLDGLRDYWGDKTNFASGTPENQLRRNIHGAINDSLDQAMSKASPGAGDAWRQTGRDLNVGMEMRANASGAADRARAKDADLGDLGSFGLKSLYNNNRHGIAEAGYGAASSMANGGAKLGSLLQGAPAAAAGSLGGQYSSENSKPLRVDQAALDLLSGGSKGAELGQWRDQIAQAAGSPDPGAVQATITRLTMSDPEFRIKMLPLLRQQAGGQR